MHVVRSLVVLLAAASVAQAQAPKTVPGSAVTFRVATMPIAETQPFVWALAKTPQTPAELETLLKAAQAVRSMNIVQLPKVTQTSGKSSTVSVCEAKKIITGFDAAGEPKLESVHEGTVLKVRVNIEKDGKTADVRLDAKHTVINTNVPATPVTTFIKAVSETGTSAPPVPFTQFYEKPDVQTAKHAGDFAVPLGHSRVHDLGTLTLTDARTMMPAVLAKVPYMNRLFTSKKHVVEKVQVYLITTVESVNLSAADEFVAEYRQAVADGRLADAKAFAEKALAADPACFAK